MKLFEKIKIKLKNGKSRQIRICNIPILQYDVRQDGHFHLYLPFFKKNKINIDKPVIYLKVNSESYFSFLCLQHWIEAIDILDYTFFIICDKENLEKEIYKRITFKNSNINFIKSCKNKGLKNIVKNITTPNWENAGYAHLTTFFHAYKHNIKSFWNIDADDTFFCILPEKIAKILEIAQNQAEKENISLYSLDMWRSRTSKKAWTFGVTYTKDVEMFIKAIKQQKDKNWQKLYINADNGINVDWFMTYLKDNAFFNIQTFYVEKLYFIHFGPNGAFLHNILGCNLCQWENGKLNYPIISKIFSDENLGNIPIAEDCIRINIPIKQTESKDILFAYNLIGLNKKIAKLWGVSEEKMQEGIKILNE